MRDGSNAADRRHKRWRTRGGGRTNLGVAIPLTTSVVVIAASSLAWILQLGHAWIPALSAAPHRPRRQSSPAVLLYDASTGENSLVVDLDGSRPKIPKSDGNGNGNGEGGEDEVWKGEVVSNTPNGEIRGCVLEPVTDQESSAPETEWIVTIDGIQADLGRFGDAVYRKLVSDAKRQRFQGFRPGTLPPFLEPSYRIAAMDECARETVLEALQQNGILPFESARAGMTFEQVSIPPKDDLSKRKKNKKRKKPNQSEFRLTDASSDATASADPGSVMTDDAAAEASTWKTLPSIGEAVAAGWRPGQSFSFVARNVRGQRVTEDYPAPQSPSVGGLLEQ